MYYLTHFLHWLAGLLGVLAFMVVFSFMPSLLGVAISDQIFATTLGIPLSSGIVAGFSLAWRIGLLVVGLGLFSWITFMFLMSTHNLVVGLVGATTRERHDGERAALISMGAVLVVLAMVFTWIMFGASLSLWPILYALALVGVTGWLLYTNVSEYLDV